MAELHPESKALLALAKATGAKPYQDLETVEEAREANVKKSQYLAGSFRYQGSIREINIPSEHDTDGILATVYRPLATEERPAYAYKHASLNPKPVVLVYFHGGGMVVGCRKSVDVMCQIISARAYAIVVNVEYRLAPEHKFPAMMQDAETAMRWVMENKTRLGARADSVVGVGGDSAGGTISASVCHSVPEIAFQVLIYPQVDVRCRFESYKTYADGYLLTQKMIDWFQEQFLSSEEDKTDPRLSPLLRGSFKDLPPCLFIVAECDPLADDSFEYAKNLSEAGVQNELYLLKGALHAFFHCPGCHDLDTANMELVFNKKADIIVPY